MLKREELIEVLLKMPQTPIAYPSIKSINADTQRYQTWLIGQTTQVLDVQSGNTDKLRTPIHRNIIQKYGLHLPSKPIKFLQKEPLLILPDLAPRKSNVFFWSQSIVLTFLFIISTILDVRVFSSNIVGMLGMQFIIVVVFSTTLASIIKKNRLAHILSFERLTTTVSMKAIKLKHKKRQREFIFLHEDTMTYIHAIKNTVEKQRGLK